MKTTAELRGLLLKSMERVEAGLMEPLQARELCRIASQVNESVYAECRTVQLKTDLGQTATDFGKMELA